MKKVLVFGLCLFPLLYIVVQAASNQLGPDGGKEVVLYFGTWSMQFLLVTLAVSPLSRRTHLRGLLRYRRMVGLFTWFYASLHLFSVLTVLLGWSWQIFLEEFSERPYMAVGILAWLFMVPLGVTSNRFMQRRLGKNWKRLHRLVYFILLLACIHLIWLVRSDFLEAFLYSLVAAALMFERLVFWLSRKKRQHPA